MSPVIILAAIGLFGAIHSATAALSAKAWARRLLGRRAADGLYRLFYNTLATITALPTVLLPALLPDRPLYAFPAYVRWITLPAQLAAALGMIASLWRVDLPRFLGVRQLLRLLRGEPEPRDPPPLVTTGVHGWVRHPLYFFSLVFLWLSPVMTVNLLAFNLGVTLYFWIGSVFEERKLRVDFGQAYREHQRRVPRLFPWPRP